MKALAMAVLSASMRCAGCRLQCVKYAASSRARATSSPASVIAWVRERWQSKHRKIASI